MKFTTSWLNEHLPTRLSPTELGERLTMIGLELESMVELGAGLEKVYSGRLLAVERHPNADRLTLCQVRVGAETLTIVCGATNHKSGDMVAVARDGATLPNGLTIKKGKIRGEASEGMLCSLQELGLAEKAEGILILPPESPEGVPIAQLLGRNDTLLEVNVTPNRGDCLGVRGIARDLGAATGDALLPLTHTVTEDHAVAQRHPVGLILEDATGCPRYAGRVIQGVRIGPSPSWLTQRLEVVGLRSINNVVDITNYVMLELGHPLHAFDLTLLKPPVMVRAAKEGELLRTLDGVERVLNVDATLIADQNRPLALGGIMGGEESGVTEQTENLFLEAAYFDPVRIARTGRRLGILSESRFRFERGVDPDALRTVLDRATHLIQTLAGGSAGPILLADAGTWQPPSPVPFRPERAARLGGIEISPEACVGYLTRLGCVDVSSGREDASSPPGTLWFQPPSHRHDLRREEDLLEEVVRLYGYDRVPSRMPVATLAPPRPENGLLAQTRRILSGLGYLEAINYAFVGQEVQRRFDPQQKAASLVNPISEDLAVLRTTLTAGLVEAARRNLSRGNVALRLFESGRIFRMVAGEVEEEERLALLLCGPLQERSWHTPRRMADLFDLKGDLESLWAGLRLPPMEIAPGGPAFLHPGRCGVIRGNEGSDIGWFGALHPAVAEAMGLDHALLLAELALEPLLARSRQTRPEAISRYPAVTRDFAFQVPVQVTARAVLEEIAQVEPTLIRAVTLFDLYTGEHLPEGMKSLGLSVTFQAMDRTLTEAEIQPVADRIVAEVAKRLNATLRGG